jgi:exopolyphosphatase/guanosine-5'-triphosphate,3'-diphosphate pyrophosphatase
MSIYDPKIVHNTVINKNIIGNMYKTLKDMTVQERWNVKGLQKERADVIPAGIYIMQHIFEGLNKDSVIISENDNLEGIVVKYMLSEAGQ